MEVYIQNVLDLLKEAINTEDWGLVSEAVNQLENEEISPKDFFIKEMQEVSSEGGFRQASIHCSNYSTTDDVVEFTLSRGSFATILLREVMKPSNPIIAGF